MVVTLDEPADLSAYGEVDRRDRRTNVRCGSRAADTAAVTAQLLAEHDVRDLTVEDPPIDDVIELVFASGTAK